MGEQKPRFGLKEYLDNYPREGYETLPVGPIDRGPHADPFLMGYCAEGVFRMEALSKYKKHIEECEPCWRNFEAVFGMPYGDGPGKKSIPEEILQIRKD